MSEPSKTDGNSSQVTSGIAFVALLLGLFAVQNTFFQPTRPPMESADRTFSENVRSRLWQDPFEAVEEHRKKYSAQTREAPASLSLPAEITYTNEEKQTEKFILKALQAQKNEKNKLIESPDLQARYAYEHNGQEPKPVCYRKGIDDRSNPYPDSSLIANSMDELRCQVATTAEDSSEKKLHVLAVMVPNGPYAEDKEWRLRTRYAVVAALTELGYTPEDPEHIDYVDFDRTCKTTLQGLREEPNNEKLKKELNRKTHFCHMGSVMPYEWFSIKDEQEKEQEKVLLLWLDNGGFVNADNRTPLKMLGFLKNEIFPESDPKYSFNIIGPFGSDALDTMYREVFGLYEKDMKSKYYVDLEDTLFYVGAATVNFDAVNRKRGLKDSENENKKWLDNKIIRTISTQDKLADLLLCELALRGVTPYHVGDGTALSNNCSERLSFDEFRHRKNSSPHHIVLIGERDTYYSRQLTKTFSNTIKKFGAEDKTPWVHAYSYLRGLDGITSEHAPSGHKEETKNKNHEQQANNTNASNTREQMERPVGPSQLDYLLNLAGQIKRLDKQYAHEGGIKAIGITGHDTYDKLLILQALRLQFPGVLFFTTDLDARFFHPSEIKWTRNLLVASPFGLQLNEDFQKKTQPFRENYQTSLFLAAQLALCSGKTSPQNSECNADLSKANREEWIDYPRLFEIGNEGAVNISHEPNRFLDSYAGDFRRFMDSTSITDDRKKESKKSLDNYELKTSLGFIFMMLFLAELIINFFTPKDFRKHLIRFILGLVVIFTIASSIFAIAIALNYRFELESLSFTNGTSMWPSVLMKIMAVILSGYFFYRIHKKLSVSCEDTEKNYLQLETNKNDLINGGNDIPNCSGAESILIDHWRKDLLNGEVKDKQLIQFSTLWGEYQCWSIRKLTIVRVSIALLTTVFLCAAMIISTAFNDVAFHHIRGQSNYVLNFVFLGLAVVFYVLLILYVAEKVHLSSHFIKLLANPKVEINWSPTVVQTYRNKYGLPEGVVCYRILLDFINDHTYAPNKFIYYPFFCLFLIVMSRNYYFDNWPTTPFVLTVYAFFALLTLISAIRLRAAALYARNQILDRLENNSADAPVNACWCKSRSNVMKLRSFIGEIRDFKEGIYRPLAYHPMVLNSLVPFSSIGGIYLIEYLV